MKFKKSQASIEFVLILIFLFVFVSGIIYVIGLYTIELNHQNRISVLDDFASSIKIELETLNNAKPGYYREVVIPSYIMHRYNVTIKSSYLILQDLDYASDDDFYYYDLSGSYIINTTYNVTTNTKTLIFKKSKNENYDGIDLSES